MAGRSENYKGQLFHAQMIRPAFAVVYMAWREQMFWGPCYKLQGLLLEILVLWSHFEVMTFNQTQ